MRSQEGLSLSTEPFAIEKRELEAVLDAGIFAPSSNAARLLRFVCERHFDNATDAVTESDLAIHALGRRSDFDPQRDSIVRVEAHRVRKRLQEYYETDGATHKVKIVIPRGQYAPRFVYLDATPVPDPDAELPVPQDGSAGSTASLSGEPADFAPVTPLGEAQEHHEDVHPAHRSSTSAGRRIRIGAVLLIIAVAAVFVWRYRTANRPAENLSSAPVAAVSGDTVRILAGLDSGEFVDRAGTRWSADEYFSGGTVSTVRYYSLALADDPAIYGHARTGENFGYDIPLRPGNYEMRLMFAESAEVAILGAVGEGARSFHVTANGVQILPPLDDRHMRELDVVADAGGTNTADVKVFKDISPAPDGKLHLRFIGRNQRALVNAIEIVPGLKGRMRPLRWRANETPYTDQAGNLWLSDRYFRSGRLSRFHAVVGGTQDPGLYEGERFGSFSYYIPVAAGASYTVKMYFAENYFGGWAAQASQPRIFNVFANHTPVIHDFDVAREVGGSVKALSKSFRGIRPNSFDKIVLSFEPSTEFAIVNAIAVEDDAKE